jgi:hypothetical protein
MGGGRLLVRGSSRESHVRLVEGTLPSSLASDMRILFVCAGLMFRSSVVARDKISAGGMTSYMILGTYNDCSVSDRHETC